MTNFEKFVNTFGFAPNTGNCLTDSSCSLCPICVDDEDRLTLVLTDKNNGTRAVRLKPIIRPVLTITEDCGGVATNSIYLTEGHINAMRIYDELKTIKEVLDEQTGKRSKNESNDNL